MDSIYVLRELSEPRKHVRRNHGNQLDIDFTIWTLDEKRFFTSKALLDSGCTGTAIDKEYVRQNQIVTKKYPIPIPVYNIDATFNEVGLITNYIELGMQIGNHKEKMTFVVSQLGKSSICIGHNWLKIHNSSINWKTLQIEFNRCSIDCSVIQLAETPDKEGIKEDITTEGEHLLAIDLTEAVHVQTFQTMLSKIAEAKADKRKKTFEQMVPKQYHEFKDIFEKEAFDKLLPQRPWDHPIELIPGTTPVDYKIYPLSPPEQTELDKFLDKNIKTGRIQLSKSPMTLLFFFIKKKDRSLRPVQDYQKLNNVTIKNRYPLQLIQELINKLKGAKYFIKMDIQ